MIFLPFLGIFVYLIANGHGMAERNMQAVQAQQAQMDTYVKSVAGSGDSAEQIAKGKQLLDSGAITQTEYDQLKAKALAELSRGGPGIARARRCPGLPRYSGPVAAR